MELQEERNNEKNEKRCLGSLFKGARDFVGDLQPSEKSVGFCHFREKRVDSLDTRHGYLTVAWISTSHLTTSLECIILRVMTCNETTRVYSFSMKATYE